MASGDFPAAHLAHSVEAAVRALVRAERFVLEHPDEDVRDAAESALDELN